MYVEISVPEQEFTGSVNPDACLYIKKTTFVLKVKSCVLTEDIDYLELEPLEAVPFPFTLSSEIDYRVDFAGSLLLSIEKSIDCNVIFLDFGLLFLEEKEINKYCLHINNIKQHEAFPYSIIFDELNNKPIVWGKLMTNNFITLQKAYCAAAEFFRSIQYQTTFAGNSQLTLEEFEFIKSLNCWFITLGFVPVRREEIQEQYNTSNREYRIFKVNAVTKEVEFMKKGFMGHQEDCNTEEITVTSQSPISEMGWSVDIGNRLIKK